MEIVSKIYIHAHMQYRKRTHAHTHVCICAFVYNVYVQCVYSFNFTQLNKTFLEIYFSTLELFPHFIHILTLLIGKVEQMCPFKDEETVVDKVLINLTRSKNTRIEGSWSTALEISTRWCYKRRVRKLPRNIYMLKVHFVLMNLSYLLMKYLLLG